MSDDGITTELYQPPRYHGEFLHLLERHWYELNSFFRKIEHQKGKAGYQRVFELAEKFLEEQLDPHTGEDMFVETYFCYRFVKELIGHYQQGQGSSGPQWSAPYKVRMVDGKVVLEDKEKRWHLVELRPLPTKEEITQQQQEKKTLADLAAELKLTPAALEFYLKDGR